MSIPTASVLTPAIVASLAGSEAVEPVWQNEAGGLTFRLTGQGGVRYVKWAPAEAVELDLTAEAERLAWAAPHTPVPQVLDTGQTHDGAWLMTAGLPGRSAVDPYWIARPATAARAIGAGLRSLHDALPVDDCPFSWSIESRIARAQASQRHRVAQPPATDRLVVCHGDACAPNTLMSDDGRAVAHVDLGSLGVADRWADLAVASYSLGWNYGDGFEADFFDGYGVAPDTDRIAYYRLLWDLT